MSDERNWTRDAPTQPGVYRTRSVADGRDMGTREVVRATQGGKPVLVALWAGKWHPVEDFRREWCGPLAAARDAEQGGEG